MNKRGKSPTAMLTSVPAPKSLPDVFLGHFLASTFGRCDSAYQQKDTVELLKANMKRWAIDYYFSIRLFRFAAAP